MNYKQLENYDDLAVYLDDLTAGATAMVKRTGSPGQTAEWLIQAMLKFINTGNLFLLIGEEDGKFRGFVMAMLYKDKVPYVELLALWAPHHGKEVRLEAFEMIKGWMRMNGAKIIRTTITRHPDAFFKFFHEPLGFKKIGYILEAEA